MRRLRDRIHEVIFEADTPAGKAFDVILLVAIILSVITVSLESINRLEATYHDWFYFLEWGFTILFTAEYILRLWAVRRPIRYATSFFGIIDLLAILPTYLSVLFPGTQYLLVIRILRLFRIFRIFKLGKYIQESNVLFLALKASRLKITVFLSAVLLVVVIFGSVLYVVETDANSGFDSIPRSIYWAIVTLTTVGYGDISPTTPLGQFIAAVIMIMGYAIIAVPTGIVSVAIARAEKDQPNTQCCPYCTAEGHHFEAIHCYRCGELLHPTDR